MNAASHADCNCIRSNGFTHKLYWVLCKYDENLVIGRNLIRKPLQEKDSYVVVMAKVPLRQQILGNIKTLESHEELCPSWMWWKSCNWSPVILLSIPRVRQIRCSYAKNSQNLAHSLWGTRLLVFKKYLLLPELRCSHNIALCFLLFQHFASYNIEAKYKFIIEHEFLFKENDIKYRKRSFVAVTV